MLLGDHYVALTQSNGVERRNKGGHLRALVQEPYAILDASLVGAQVTEEDADKGNEQGEHEHARHVARPVPEHVQGHSPGKYENKK